jgi:hypothetical protein
LALDWEPRRLLAFLPASGIESNGGGLAFVWAEENTRDAIFDALRRREVYATSGTRPVLRLFGGWDIPTDACDMQNLIEVADQNGVPMGGTLPALPEGESPSPKFFISALQDPGSEGAPGTPLERIQVVKGWVDDNGEAQEKVFDVAGGDRPASVNLNTCATSGEGYATLCTVWTDPEFDPAQRAFYYARILENPVCRWSTLLTFPRTSQRVAILQSKPNARSKSAPGLRRFGTSLSPSRYRWASAAAGPTVSMLSWPTKPAAR